MDKWQLWAKRVNDWRLIPRLLVVTYGWFCFEVGLWFMGLAEPSVAQATFVSVIWGAATGWFGFYCKSGTKSNDDS